MRHIIGRMNSRVRAAGTYDFDGAAHPRGQRRFEDTLHRSAGGLALPT